MGFIKTVLGDGINDGLTGYTNGICELADAKPQNVLQDENGFLHFVDLDIYRQNPISTINTNFQTII